jgi:hypothetical protein
MLILGETLYSGTANYLAWLFLFLFAFSIFFRGYYPTPAKIWFIIVANRGQTHNIGVNLCNCIYYKPPQLLVIPVTTAVLPSGEDAI